MTTKENAAQAGEQGGKDKAKLLNCTRKQSASSTGYRLAGADVSHCTLGDAMNTSIQRDKSVAKKATKIERILQAFVSGEQLHRFTAFQLRETALHSTVATLVHSYGLTIDRKLITIERQGDKVQVMLYWLSPNSQEKAEQLLKQMKSRRTVTTES